MSISKNVFYPSPNVDSAVISFSPKIERNKEFEKVFFKMVQDCFKMRRKTLHNNLKEFLDNTQIEKVYTDLNLDQNIRAQQLSLDDYLNMYKVIYER